MRITLLCASLGLALLTGLSSLHAEEAAKPNPRAIIKTSMGDFEIELFRDAAPRTVANFLGLANGTKEWKNTAGVVQTRPFYDGLQFHRVMKSFMIQGGCPSASGTGDPGYEFADEMNAKSLGLDKLKFLENGSPNRITNTSFRDPKFSAHYVFPLLKKLGKPSTPAEINKLNQSQIQELQKLVMAKLAAMTVEDAYSLRYTYINDVQSVRPTKGTLAMANKGPNTNGSQFFVNLEDTPFLTGKHTVFAKVVSGFDVVQKIGAVQVNRSNNKPLKPVKILSIRSVMPKTAGVR